MVTGEAGTAAIAVAATAVRFLAPKQGPSWRSSTLKQHAAFSASALCPACLRSCEILHSRFLSVPPPLYVHAHLRVRRAITPPRRRRRRPRIRRPRPRRRVHQRWPI